MTLFYTTFTDAIERRNINRDFLTALVMALYSPVCTASRRRRGRGRAAHGGRRL